ncbi:amino acid adenylation domain-containing protein [Planomonospora sp. ID91781]|uniref:amino acid adenylation domain-containing protein n=1 Tax=Planomonospora sp. ID91781 TaxID=2738135 RepID=UPI0018C37D64|nr:amino acid adenylation domain-containing protein [Planomonospora sp. ID91781]MBG0822753.1 amino acid adenylation domain-containing protein [Planomonospora sp. ID91781]
MTALHQEPDRPALLAPPDLPVAAGPSALAPAERHEYRISPRRWRALTEAARAHGARPEALIVAAFAEVLRGWAKSPDFTLAYRSPEGTTVPVAAPRTGDRFGVRAAKLDQAIARALAGTATGAQTGAQTDTATGTGAGTAGLPVVVGTLEAGPPARPQAGRESAPATADESGSAERPLLDLGFRQEDGGLYLRWEAGGGVFPPGLCASMSGVLTALLERLADGGPDWTRTRPDVLPGADRRLVDEVNSTAGPVPDALLHEIVFARAAERPDAEAVVDGRRRLTYGELSCYARRIGRRLRRGRVRANELVAVVMEKGWEQYAAVYGVLASGAAYLPVDAAAPAERLARLIERGRVRHVLTQSHLAERLAWPEGVTVHRVDQEFETGDDGPLPSVQSPGDLAYVIFTSGSTGEPKGVMVDHRGVANLVADVNARFGVGPDDRLFGISGLHFDASVYDVFGVPAAGGTVVLPDPFERAQPDRWTDRVKEERVTLWNSVPAIMEMLVGQAEIRDDRPLSTLRLAVLSGDWIPLTLPGRLRAQAGDLLFVGSGGPTETICWSVFSPVGEVDPAWTSIPYGKPITNQRYLVVDDELRRRPVWAVGQMAVVSDVGLAHGYFDDPERTAAQFTALPESGERAYLTGDVGRHLPDGNIEILGREDHQVKIQGYRIELGEIEAVLRDQPSVEAAVVVAPRSGWGVRRLHAFVTGSQEAGRDRPDPRALRARLRELLPSYMVPAKVEVVDALPLTRNGKTDRLALTERAGGATAAQAPGHPAQAPGHPAQAAGHPPSAGREDPAAQAVPPAGPDGPGSALELVIGALMGDVLGSEPVERTGNFLRLGGDSLSGTRLAYALRELLGVEVPLRQVFDNPVPADLAAAIAAVPVHGAAAVAAAELIAELSEREEEPALP